MHKERFAPSPTGPLHLGHAFSALTAWDHAQAQDGAFVVRIEDIDRARSRPEWEAAIFEDLAWLGIAWATPVLRQSQHMSAYCAALQMLWEQQLLFPCDCTRRDILEAATAPQEGVPALGPDGIIYPGTCRRKARPDGVPGAKLLPEDVTLRLDMEAAIRALPDAAALGFEETGPHQRGRHQIDASALTATVGDVVLARRDMGTSYHLSVVVDDAAQAISHVTRGEDLFEATAIHVLLQHLLGLPTPVYHHHALVRDDQGKRLAKRDDARALAKYRAEGATPAEIRTLLGL